MNHKAKEILNRYMRNTPYALSEKKRIEDIQCQERKQVFFDWLEDSLKPFGIDCARLDKQGEKK